MPIYVADLARAGMTPDWRPGMVPRCVPFDNKLNQHGERSTMVVNGIERMLHLGRWRSVDVLACPVTWRPHPEQIASARRGYDNWWQAALGPRWAGGGWDAAGRANNGGDAEGAAVEQTMIDRHLLFLFRTCI